MRRVTQLASGVACIALASSGAMAADMPMPPECVQAVSALNGKLEGAGTWIDDDHDKGGRIHGGGSLSFPLGCLIGVQLDGAIGDLDGETTGGGAIHIFTRDPSSYLFGVQGQYLAVGNDDIWRIGGEAHFYLQNFSIEGFAGYEHSDVFKGEFTAVADLAFYPIDDLRLSVGYRRFLDTDVGAVAFEWQPGIGLPLSVFAEGQVGTDHYASIFAGLRVYFGGEEKSLIRRHREDDPENLLFKLIRNPKKGKACVDSGGEGYGGYGYCGYEPPVAE